MSLGPVVIFALRAIFFVSTISSCLLLPFLYTNLCDFYESLLRTAAAMALTPWTAFVCAILVLPLFPIGFILAPVGFLI
jgi:hypothetical protein